MTILGIETSCDETAAAVITGNDNHVFLTSNTLATSLALHAKTGGIIPEQAAREQVKYMLPVLTETLKSAFQTTTLQTIDAIAVTYGPGLIGSLLIGVETAKTLAYVLKKPIIPVNHMVGHIYANWLQTNPAQPGRDIPFPLLALVISGGHTDLLLMKKHGAFQLLGGTRDDACGEAFDKIGRMLGLSYPAGPDIERLAATGNPKRFHFPRPLMHEKTYEFSFSGLKTAVLREVMQLKKEGTLDAQTTADISRGTLDAIIDCLVKRTLRAAQEYSVEAILLSGGVAANQTLRDIFAQKMKKQMEAVQLFAPAKDLCTDNAAMIATAAYFNFHPTPWQAITADPELYFD